MRVASQLLRPLPAVCAANRRFQCREMSDSKRKSLMPPPAGVKTLESFFGGPAKKQRDAAPAAAAAAGASGGEGQAPAAEEQAKLASTSPNRPPRLPRASGEAGPSQPLSNLPPEALRRIEINKSIAIARKLQSQVEARVRMAREAGDILPLGELLLEGSWRAALAPELQKESFANLEKFLTQEWAGREKIFPEQWNIFRALNSCPISKVKVVILGQDPYHDDGQAQGLSFSVPKGTKVPSSLQNIFKEIESDVGIKKPPHGDLERWAAQGVLLLNTVLTVRAHQANSHQKRGWEVFTDGVIRTVSKEGKGAVFLLWGKQAQDKARLVNGAAHCVLQSPHPSGLSAHRGFYGCKHFSQANAYLEKNGTPPVDWDLNQ